MCTCIYIYIYTHQLSVMTYRIAIFFLSCRRFRSLHHAPYFAHRCPTKSGPWECPSCIASMSSSTYSNTHLRYTDEK